MEALILSCSTGGGHNSAGEAMKEELRKRGHNATMFDPNELVSEGLADIIAKAYVKLVQFNPNLFGIVYLLGEGYRRLPFRSPVYYAGFGPAKKLKEYLEEHDVDVIVMPHLFPAEMITYLKKCGEKLPTTYFLATDYTCIPFTEETDCDYYVVPKGTPKNSFIKRGIPENKILSLGIPVKESFDEKMSKEEAKARLGLAQEVPYYLLTGGSIGAGKIAKTVAVIYQYLEKQTPGKLIVICGNNKKLYDKLAKKYGEKIIVINHTDAIATYMKACEVFISKPGGLSSTEAAVSNIPFFQISPIPGCESANIKFFSENGMSVAVKNVKQDFAKAMQLLKSNGKVSRMKQCQNQLIDITARKEICDLIEENFQREDMG